MRRTFSARQARRTFRTRGFGAFVVVLAVHVVACATTSAASEVGVSEVGVAEVRAPAVPDSANTSVDGSANSSPDVSPDRLANAREVVVNGAVFVLEYDDEDEETSRVIESAIVEALPHVKRWGEFNAPMRVTIHPSHDALEIAVNRRNYPWLRAWAKYDSIDIQSPRTWGALFRGRHHVVELVTHELTHCLMYQRSGTAQSWQRKGIPLWFREGMASVTASQGYRRPKDIDLWRYLSANPEKDPVLRADAMYQRESDVVYGAAHRAFDFLLLRYGEKRVLSVVESMGRDEMRFGEAFNREIGIDAEAFAEEFVRYLRWQGWRGPAEQAFRIYE